MTTNLNDSTRSTSPSWPSPGPFNPPWPWPWPWPGPMPLPMPGPTMPGSGWPTRGVAPLSPEQFAPAEPHPTTPGPSALAPAERETLRRALEIVKANRDQASPWSGHRTLAALGYMAGFLESRGHAQLGDFLATIPPSATPAATQLDRFIEQVAAALDERDTRMGPAAVVGWIAIGAAGSAVWDGIKWAYNQLR